MKEKEKFYNKILIKMKIKNIEEVVYEIFIMRKEKKKLIVVKQKVKEGQSPKYLIET